MNFGRKHLVKSCPRSLRYVPLGEEHCRLVAVFLRTYSKIPHGESEKLEISLSYLSGEVSSNQLICHDQLEKEQLLPTHLSQPGDLQFYVALICCSMLFDELEMNLFLSNIKLFIHTKQYYKTYM